MARDHSLRSGWFGGIGGSRNPSHSASTVSRPLAAIEVLEERRLLSVSGSPIIIPPTPTPVPPVTFAARGYGVTLNLKAGQPFNGYLGDLVGAKVPAGFIVSSSVNWGDGTAASAGTVKIGSTGNIDVGGSHTYTRIGRYAITIAVTATPAPAPTGAAAAPILLYLGSIHSKANVTSSGSVTLHETAGVPFTAVVGTFSYIGVPTGLAANIDWGDGSAPSAGKIAISAIWAAALFNFKVIGSHTYANPGKYPIVVTITQQLGPPGSLAPIRLVTTIDSTAIVAATGLNLDGTITGTLSPAPSPPTAANIVRSTSFPAPALFRPWARSRLLAASSFPRS